MVKFLTNTVPHHHLNLRFEFSLQEQSKGLAANEKSGRKRRLNG